MLISDFYSGIGIVEPSGDVTKVIGRPAIIIRPHGKRVSPIHTTGCLPVQNKSSFRYMGIHLGPYDRIVDKVFDLDLVRACCRGIDVDFLKIRAGCQHGDYKYGKKSEY